MIRSFVLFAVLLFSVSHAQTSADKPAVKDSASQAPPEHGILTIIYKQGLPVFYKEALELGLTDGNDTILFEGISFYKGEGESWPHSTPIKTPPSGNLTLWFSFVTPVGDTISSGRAEIPCRSGYIWAISFAASNRNPMMFCSDCYGHKTFPIREGFAQGESDSLWVYWAGSEGGKGLLER